ncbi:hypothetical protein [Duncaniella muris]|uniref:hypothetical protein n=1 Tax=Duncaniella muris TaxID=2094150 RepID=UPI0025B7A2C2|nr:hypothetical protein [Duncaniella muris]
MTVTYNSTSNIRPPRRLLLTLLLSALFLCAPAAKRIEKSVLENVPGRSQVVSGYSKPDSVTDRLAQMPLHAVEGLWRFASEGSLMAIERNSDRAAGEYEAETTVYRMVIVRAADMALRPGTVMGYLTPTAKRGVYDARIYTSRLDNGTTLHAPKKFTVTLTDDDSRISISDYGSSLRFNWWRLLPYMYRYLFTRQEKNPGAIQGCLRVFPAPSIPSEPRYL